MLKTGLSIYNLWRCERQGGENFFSLVTSSRTTLIIDILYEGTDQK